MLNVSRSAYYKWAAGKISDRILENKAIAELVEKIHNERPDKGYRRINDDLRHDHGIHVNDKRILRICRKKSIKSTIKYRSHGCTRRAKNPQYIAENILSRKFHADTPNEKWLTDVTEFKWYEDSVVHKLYLSAILDLYDRRIVSFVISEHNDNPLVFKTFDKAVKANPDAHPLFHSDRGFQYTNRNPMEGFWGILKREMYYGRRFTSKCELMRSIEAYIHYYNHKRVQRNLGILTPIEKHTLYLAA